ncbi:MAG: DNA translocase FtsK 4TM domain-containing protein [Hyphomicrobiaceae bacterium]
MALETSEFGYQRLLPHKLEDLLIGWIGRLSGILLLALCAGLWLALLTWSANDPSLNFVNPNTPTNILGRLGASVSDLLLQTVGLSSVVALTCLVVWGLQLLLTERVDRFQVRIFLAVISLLAIAGGSSALPTAASWQFLHGYGGVLGDFTYNLIAGLFAQLRLTASNALAGMVLFASGFWAFTCAVGLDRERMLQIVSFERRRAKRQPRAEGASLGWSFPWQPVARTETPEGGNEPRRSEPRFTFPRLWTDDADDRDRRPEPSLDSSTRPISPAGLTERLAAEAPGPDWRRGVVEIEDAPDDGANFECFSNDEFDDDDLDVVRRFAPPGAARRAQQDDVLIVQPEAAETPRQDDLPAFLKPHKSKAERAYQQPSLNELTAVAQDSGIAAEQEAALQAQAEQLACVLADFRVQGEIKNVRPGPVVTLFEFEPARGTKSSRIISLADDVARSMSATSARISVMPGRNVIGIELPNRDRAIVSLRELLESSAYRNCDARLPLALGKDIGGEPVVADLSRMPHLLVAGTTGSGKSVAVNAMILSLLYRKSPDECRFLMIDPKMLELSAYNSIPHLLSPVITDPVEALAALNWAVSEMEERYKRMTELGVRNIEVYNNRVRHAQRRGEPLIQRIHTGFDPDSGEALYEDKHLDLEPMAYIVIVVDEFADLMSVAGKEIEGAVQRLAQMARAAGMHLIMATQRPSVDVVTGTIKANFPTRIGFKVASKIDSRTILNEQGAEQLLGQGDMLLATGGAPMVRAHGPFVSDAEVEAVTTALRVQGPPQPVVGLSDVLGAAAADKTGGRKERGNDRYDDAVVIVRTEGKASISYLQRKLAIGYNRAASLIERMEQDGIVSPADQAGRRTVVD